MVNNGRNYHLNGNGHSSGYGTNMPDSGGSRQKRFDQEELIDLKAIMSLLNRHKWMILFFTLLSTGAAYYLAFHHLSPVYQSSSTVEILDHRNNYPGRGGDNNISQMILNSFHNDGGRTIQNEIYTMESREVSDEVAEQLMAYKHQPDGKIYPILWNDFPEDSSLAAVETVSSRIRSKLSVAPLERGSNILSVRMESHSPYEASRLVNLVVNKYLEKSNIKRRESAGYALTFLENEKRRVQGRLNQAEEHLGSFLNEYDLVDLESQATTGVTSVSNLEAEHQSILIELESVVSAIQSHETRLESIRPGLASQYSQALGPTISRYQSELADLSARRFVILSNNPSLKENPDSEPEVRRLNNQIRELQEEIEELTDVMINRNEEYLGFMAGGDGNITQEISNIQNSLIQLKIQRNQLEAQSNVLAKRIEETQMFLNRVPEARIQQARLQREVNSYERLFITLSEQAAEIALWEQTQTSIGNIIDSANVPSAPIRPVKIQWLAAGLMVGLGFPFAFFFLKENLNRRIQSVKDLDSGTYPVLSVIYDYTEIKKKTMKKLKKQKETLKVPEDLTIALNPVSAVAESYRRLAYNTVYSDPDRSPQVFMITSSESKEGKTTTSANMGAALAELGQRVLIIDCDLRRPHLHRFFEKPSHPGLMEMLFENVATRDLIQQTVVPNLSILTSGKKAPNPASILGSGKLHEFIEEMKSEYDYILLDTAPYGIIADAAPLMDMMDGVIVVTKFGQTRKSALNHTLQQLKKTRAPVTSVVLNGYNSKKSLDDSETNKMYSNMYKGYYDYVKEPV